ncbi:hypothetical protein V0M98_32660 (plasmid) [Pseudomonas silesiensis]|uniref:hypothetical protein n=1 Tax=Pseudomonas silesiensis TaxID=1853130 RepID=UPI0030D3A26E
MNLIGLRASRSFPGQFLSLALCDVLHEPPDEGFDLTDSAIEAAIPFRERDQPFSAGLASGFEDVTVFGFNLERVRSFS